MEADFVIIGAGSAGCAMAYRLSATGASVLVIEFGGTDAGPLIQMPGALSYPMNMARYDWGFKSEPEPHLGGRRLACPRGKVIGGSSSINGMVYVRGHAKDFDMRNFLFNFINRLIDKQDRIRSQGVEVPVAEKQGRDLGSIRTK